MSQHTDSTDGNQQDKAIILGCTHGGVAVARSLGKKGIKLLVLTYDSTQPGLSSRYVKEWKLCPHPNEEEALVQNLLSYADKWRGAFLVATTDYFATAVTRHKEELQQHFCVSEADWEHTRIFMEKDSTYSLADEAGVPHPMIVQPTSMAELESHLDNLQLPVMIKPVQSHTFVDIFNTKLFINETVDELRTNFQRVLDAKQEVMISEIIPGLDYKTLDTVQIYIDTKGEVAATFCCTKLRQTPPMYGVIRVGRSLKPSEELIELGMKLLRKIDYRGYASIEFKRDPRDNQLKLIEVNMRTLRMAHFPIAAGIDFPYMMFQDKMHDNQIHVPGYNENLYYIDLMSDFVDLIRYDKNRSFRHFVEPYIARHKTFPYLHLSDPMPFFYQFAVRGVRFIRRKLGR